MRLEQEVGCDRRLDLVGGELRETGLRVLADIGVGPAVEAALLHADQIIGGEIVAEPVALLHDRPQLAGLRMKGERGRIARAGGDCRLVRAVGVEALDRRFRLRLDAEIAGRPDADKQRPALRVDLDIAVLVALNDAKDALLGQQLGAVGAILRTS